MSIVRQKNSNLPLVIFIAVCTFGLGYVALDCSTKASAQDSTTAEGITGKDRTQINAAEGVDVSNKAQNKKEKSQMKPEVLDGSHCPFDLADLSVLRASKKKVFAHFFAPYPVSFDNKPADDDYYVHGFISPRGEKGKHLGYGGYFRQAPIPRFPREGKDWKMQNLKEEVRQAVAIGLDGFCFDILAYRKHWLWKTLPQLLDCAQEVDPDFKVMLMPDMDAVFKRRPELLVDAITDVSKHPSLMCDEKGRVVVSPFNSQNRPPEFWQKLKEDLRVRGVEMMFVPLFQAWWKYAQKYKSVSDGFSDWGCATIPETQKPPRSESPVSAHKLGKLWMAPVRPQDFRPRAYMYFEAQNSDLFRSMWKIAIEKDADWVQLITWNDYAEGSEIRPSSSTHYAFYYLTAFYTQWFKTGEMPEIKRDAIFYFYRIQSTEDMPDPEKQKKPFKRMGPASNQVELLAFLPQAGTLEIELAGVKKKMKAEAGITSFKIPLQPGTPIFRLLRDEEQILELSGKERIINKDEVVYQDFLYRADCISAAR